MTPRMMSGIRIRPKPPGSTVWNQVKTLEIVFEIQAMIEFQHRSPLRRRYYAAPPREWAAVSLWFKVLTRLPHRIARRNR